MTVRCVCESLYNSISYSFANATSDCVTPETQTTVAEHTQKEELRLCETKLPSQADLIRWHSPLRKNVEWDESERSPTVSCVAQHI